MHTAADTVQALHLLYRNRRAMGRVLTGTGALGVIAVPFIYSAAVPPPMTPYGFITHGINSVWTGILYSSPFLALGAVQLNLNTKKREEQLISAYTGGQPLPRRLKKKLKPALFLPAASLPLAR